ncbi:putative vacuolar protein sorting-associated protein [Helianthus annuus]|nr:putative vacuolar protein sorting-associated protein [Helianthus annuus]
MFGFDFCCSDKDGELNYLLVEEPKPFFLPSPLPQWPQGQGFATGRINIGELELAMIKDFEIISSYTPKKSKTDGVTFYKPVSIPDGFFTFGHYSQQTDQPLRGYVLVARAAQNAETTNPPLKTPLGYDLIWFSGTVYVWQPVPPEGYRCLGFAVTVDETEPDVEEVRCVRDDLTENCEVDDVILEISKSLKLWNTKACKTGIFCRGVTVGTFFCSMDTNFDDELDICCLRNVNFNHEAMPNLEQVEALIDHYGPTVYFHPDEVYLPSSVQWFFDNGTLLFKKGKENGIPVESGGSNLPQGGKNDGEYWLDLPEDTNDETLVKNGNLESAELYVHVKPALGGTFTDIAMWIFCPFNGPVTFTVEFLNINIEMNRVGEHVGDWEHFTLRISNFNGELWSVYFSEHSGGEWVDASNLEFIDGNKPIVYSSKCGHASFPNAGTYIQGSTKLGIGIKNDVDKSDKFIDASKRYKIIAAEYLRGVVEEPDWLQYMREWGPTVLYDGRSELEKILKHLPIFIRLAVETVVDFFPMELYGEAGPTGPKEKDNWYGDERC